MAKVTKKQIAKAFRNARQYITDTPGYHYICIVLRHRDNTISWEVTTAAVNVISERLGVTSWLNASCETWLEEIATIPKEQLTQDNMREYRLRWLGSLIKEFEN